MDFVQHLQIRTTLTHAKILKTDLREYFFIGFHKVFLVCDLEIKNCPGSVCWFCDLFTHFRVQSNLQCDLCSMIDILMLFMKIPGHGLV